MIVPPSRAKSLAGRPGSPAIPLDIMVCVAVLPCNHRGMRRDEAQETDTSHAFGHRHVFVIDR